MTGPALGPGELAAATAADRRAQLEGGLSDLDCRHCGGRVRVKKNSLAHTSIQWTADAVRRCPLYTPQEGCPELRHTIDLAVTDDRLAVAGEEPPARLVPGG
jgi:hypothetical protein